MKEKLRYVKETWKNEWSLTLFIINFFYTLSIWGMILIAATNKSFYTVDPLVRFYTFGLLPIYIGLRAGDHYCRIKSKRRSGKRLIYLWLFTLLVLGFAEFITRGRITVPPITLEIAGSVLALYAGSRYLNRYIDKKTRPPLENIFMDFMDHGSNFKTRMTTMLK